jgi:hypothetical protein
VLVLKLRNVNASFENLSDVDVLTCDAFLTEAGNADAADVVAVLVSEIWLGTRIPHAVIGGCTGSLLRSVISSLSDATVNEIVARTVWLLQPPESVRPYRVRSAQ